MIRRPTMIRSTSTKSLITASQKLSQLKKSKQPTFPSAVDRKCSSSSKALITLRCSLSKRRDRLHRKMLKEAKRSQ